MSDLAPTHSPEREAIYRRNAAWFLADNVLINLGMGITGASTVVPDLVRHLTSSEVLIGLAGNLWMVGQTLPQLLVAPWVARARRKKGWFVGPNAVARLLMLLFAVLLWRADLASPERLLGAFFACYGLAALGDGVVGVAWADLAGNSLDNRWRARVLGVTALITGVAMLGLTPVIGMALARGGFPRNYALLFGAAGALAALSIGAVPLVRELPPAGAVELADAAPTGLSLRRLWAQARHDGPLRAFIVLRVLMSLFMMASPYYVGHATGPLGLDSAVAVPMLLAMQTGGSIVGALGYTWLGARSNLLALRLSMVGALLLPACALAAGRLGPWALYLGFALSGLASSSMMSGYLNWIVGYAPSDRRAGYVALSNTVAGGMALLAPLLAGTLVARLGYGALFVAALTMAAAALLVATRALHERATVGEVA
jgi:MFS family permease